MDGRFMGVGLGNLMGIAIFTMFIIILSKVIFTKYKVAGLSELVQSV